MFLKNRIYKCLKALLMVVSFCQLAESSRAKIWHQHHQIQTLPHKTEPGMETSKQFIGDPSYGNKRIAFTNEDSDHHAENRIARSESHYYNFPSPFQQRTESNRRKFRHYGDFYTSDMPLLQPSSFGRKKLFHDKINKSTDVTEYFSKTNKRHTDFDKNTYPKNNYDILNAFVPLKSSSDIEHKFPKTILKDGQLFYRQDLNDNNSLKQQSKPKSKLDIPVRESSFDIYGEAKKLNNLNNGGSMRKNFNILLDHIRRLAAQFPITSAAIAAAGVKGSNKGMTSHTMGMALNRGYFAASARGHNQLGDFAESVVQGDGRGARGTSSVMSPLNAGDAFVKVDHSQAGIVEGMSAVDRGSATVYADINRLPNDLITDFSQTFGEAKSNLYPSNTKKSYDVNHSEIKGGARIDMRTNITNEAQQQNFRNPADEPIIIDHGGLFKGAGDPPTESEIQQVHTDIIPEGGLKDESENAELKKRKFINEVISKRIKKFQNIDFSKYEYTDKNPNPLNILPTKTISDLVSNKNDSKKAVVGNIDTNLSKVAKRNTSNGELTYVPERIHKESAGGYAKNGDSLNPKLSISSTLQNNASDWNKEAVYDSEISDEELYPNPHSRSHNLYDYDYTTGDSVEYDYDSSVHNTLYSIPEPEPLPVSPLAPRIPHQHQPNKNKNTGHTAINSSTDLRSDHHRNVAMQNNYSRSKIQSGKNTASTTNIPLTQYPNAIEDQLTQKWPSREPPISNIRSNSPLRPSPKRPTLLDFPSSSQGSWKNSVNVDQSEPNSRSILPSIIAEPTTSPLLITEYKPKTDNESPSQMMEMRFLNPGSIGMSRIIEPLKPNDPVIKLITMGRNSLWNERGILLQPRQSIPGAPEYKIPPGFRGRFFLGNYMPQNSYPQLDHHNFRTTMHSHRPLEQFARESPRIQRNMQYNQEQKTVSRNVKHQNYSGNKDCSYYSNDCSGSVYYFSCSPVFISVKCCC